MVQTCLVTGCKSRSVVEITASFFRIPAVISITHRHYGDKDHVAKVIELSKKRQDVWLHILKCGCLSESQLRNARICFKHFILGKPADLENVNDPDWIPNQNLGDSDRSVRKRKLEFDRHERCTKRAKIKETADTLVTLTTVTVADCQTEDNTVQNFQTGLATQTDLTVEHLANLFKQLNVTNTLNDNLNNRINCLNDLAPESFIGNDTKTKYFTGSDNHKVLFLLHDTIAPYLYSQTNTALSTFKQLLLMLMKLRLNLPFHYLSYRFGVAVYTVTRYFRRCLHATYCILKNLIYWPDRETLQATMPSCFKEAFGSTVTVIIDCFEVYIECPSNLMLSAECWSNYKHHKTAKTLIGITPQGSVSFISESWGGRTSEKYITEHSGFLDKIQPGDVVLADRGFLIEESVHLAGGKLKLPAFTKGKSQLCPLDIETTRQIANVRIHVERVIGSIRQKYSILYSTIPMSMLKLYKNGISVYDEIVLVCCVLVNLCPSMVCLD